MDGKGATDNENTRQSNCCDMATSTTSLGQKRTRTGENFIDPSDVTLHCHDFDFEQLKSSLITPTPQQEGVRNAATPAGKRGFHVDVNVAVDALSEQTSPKTAAEAFVYYGSVPWTSHVNSGGGDAEVATRELASFTELHDMYKDACDALLRSSVGGGELLEMGAAPATLPTASDPSMSPWEKHYELTTNHFFPIKNYIHRAFPSLLESASNESRQEEEGQVSESKEQVSSSTVRRPQRRLVMEVGCGNGSAILTFLRHCPNDDYVCFDISTTAVSLLKNHEITREFISGRAVMGGMGNREGNQVELGAAALSPSLSSSTLSSRPPITTFVYDICDKHTDLDEAFLAEKAAAMKSRVKEQREPKENVSNAGLTIGASAALSADSLPPYVRGTVDQMLLIFVLCALPSVLDMRLALTRMAYWLRPGKFVDVSSEGVKQGETSSTPKEYFQGKRAWVGGRLLFRDYGILDHNMLRFLERPAPTFEGSAKRRQAQTTASEQEQVTSSSHAPTSPFFIKGDGTSQFFFEKGFTIDLFSSCGLIPIDLSYHCNEVRNRKNGKVMRKVFINAEFGVLEK